MRFDEVELESVPLGIDEDAQPLAAPSEKPSLFKRSLALITDLSLFAALALALSPLLPQPPDWQHLASLAGFVIVLSYYYFVGAWMLWGKSIGGAIFDVRISDGALSLREASMRWAIIVLGIAIAALSIVLIAMR
jgi:hypothetical protein